MKIKEEIKRELAKHTELSAEQLESLLERPKKRGFGNLAFPCFLLAKKWRLSPPQCAEKLLSQMALPAGVEEIIPTGPFLNFRYNREIYARTVIGSVLQPQSNSRAQTVIVEYSSPNIAKPFHVGHLRATLIGNCLDRLNRHLGYQTVSINHLGDWGTQFGFVWAGCELWGKPEHASVSSLVELYRRATALRDAQLEESVDEKEKDLPDVNEMARGYFLQLESGEANAVSFWKECVSVSLDYLRSTYQRLGIKFDHYTGESFYSDKLPAVEEELREKELLIESQGALGVDLGETLGFARIATPDGRSLYLTRDLATAKYRAATFAFDRALYVVGAPQALHFQQLKAVLGALGHNYSEQMTHVAFGHVQGMKTRGAGDFIELNDFLDEAYDRALAAYREQVSKRPEDLEEETVARGVALGAIIFSTLCRTNIKDVHFSWDEALRFQGDSGPYLLYACARINGIKQRAGAEGIAPQLECDFSKLPEESAGELIAVLAEAGECLERACVENEPSILCSYALELAKSFSKAYLDLKVVGEERPLAEARLTLFEGARVVLGQTLQLLGIPPLERM